MIRSRRRTRHSGSDDFSRRGQCRRWLFRRSIDERRVSVRRLAPFWNPSAIGLICASSPMQPPSAALSLMAREGNGAPLSGAGRIYFFVAPRIGRELLLSAGMRSTRRSFCNCLRRPGWAASQRHRGASRWCGVMKKSGPSADPHRLPQHRGRAHAERTAGEPVKGVGIALEYALKRSPMAMASASTASFMRSDPRFDTPTSNLHIQPLSLETFRRAAARFLPAVTVSGVQSASNHAAMCALFPS